MTILVAVTGMDVPVWVERLQRALPGMPVVVMGDDFDRAGVRYAVTWKHPPGALADLPNLQAIFSLGAGVDHVLTDPTLPDVPLLRVVDQDLTNRMSEYVVLHCLRILRQADTYRRQQAGGIWEDDLEQPAARDVRVGMLGLGVLGQDAARKLAVMGFDVAGWSRAPRTVDGLRTFAGAAGQAEFLARTDILVCLLPLTPETTGILNLKLLQGLSRKGGWTGRLEGPHLINAGRGKLQIEADILTALDTGVLASATLDVFQTEPLPAASPLWTHPRVVVTPHNAAVSDPQAVVALVARQILRHQAGEPFEHRIDRARGY
jgi:glyoxylate/hydroxypyruvate reductase